MCLPGVGAFLELSTFNLYLFRNFWAHPLDAMKSGHSGVISSWAFLQIMEIVRRCFLAYCFSTQLRSFMSSSLPYFTGLPLFGLFRLRSSLGESKSIFIQYAREESEMPKSLAAGRSPFSLANSTASFLNCTDRLVEYGPRAPLPRTPDLYSPSTSGSVSLSLIFFLAFA